MTPSINALIRHYAPEGMESRTYSYSNSALFLGGLVGSIGMGTIASQFGLPMIFNCSAALLLLHNLWMKWTISQLQSETGTITSLQDSGYK